MKPYEFKKFYHPNLGRFVYKHKGSGIIVDNIFKPFKKITSTFLKSAKPSAKKAIQSTISKASEKAKVKAKEQAGDIIMQKLAPIRNKTIKNSKHKTANSFTKKTPVKKQRESTNMIINRLISGDGFKH